MTHSGEAWPSSALWPRLPWHDWADTIATLHMWTQVVGKIRLAQAPPLNHWWHSPLYVSSRGLTTSAVPYGDRHFQLDFDFVDHQLTAVDSDGGSFTLPLRPMSVAAFYEAVMKGLASLDIAVSIYTTPVEVEVAIPFEEDEQHATYDPNHAHGLWEGLSAAHRILTEFRGGFVGKASPVQFYWGSFDLAVSRFSGRSAPPHPGGVPHCPDWVQLEAYSHELSSAGWWPSSPTLGPLFYSYMYPQPEGFEQAAVRPEAARFNTKLGEFVLRDDDLAAVDDPDAAVLEFLESTYAAGVDLAGWERAALEAEYRADGRVEGSVT